MNTTDTRAKLETLFRRIVDPAVSDLDALSDFVWFRKLALDAKDVQEALGAPTAPTNVPGATLAAAHAAATAQPDGPMWPFKKKHAGESIAHIARTDPEYLRFMLGRDLRESLQAQIREALKKAASTPSLAITNPPPADDDVGDPPV